MRMYVLLRGIVSDDRSASLSDLNETGHTKMHHDLEPWLIAVLMHTSVAVRC